MTIILFLVLLSCSQKKKNNTLPFLFWYLNSNANTITFSAEFPNIQANTRALGNEIEDITKVYAISTANHIIGPSDIALDGSFSLDLIKGFSYLFLFLNNNNEVKGCYSLGNLSLNLIPTQYSEKLLKGGKISKKNLCTGKKPAFTPDDAFIDQDFLTRAGNLTKPEMETIQFISNQILNLSELDTDRNGRIDLEEKMYIRPTFMIFYNSFSNPLVKLSSATNQFFDISYLKDATKSISFNFTMESSKVTSNSGFLRYPIPSGCSDPNNGQVNVELGNILTYIPLPGGARGGKSFYTPFNFTCGGKTRTTPESGEYIVNISGKTHTYSNINVPDLDKLSTMIFPSIQFNVSNDILNSIEYKYKVIDKKGEVGDANERQFNLTYGNSPYNSAVICNVKGVTGKFGFNCSIPKNSVSGSITSCGSNDVVYTNAKGTKFSDYSSCFVFTNDTYGTYFQYSLGQ
jgi:hypothetical protein